MFAFIAENLTQLKTEYFTIYCLRASQLSAEEKKTKHTFLDFNIYLYIYKLELCVHNIDFGKYETLICDCGLSFSRVRLSSFELTGTVRL